MSYLYIFIDVSGNYDFSDTGTQYVVFTSVLALDIQPAVLDLYNLKHALIDQGVNLEYFHANQDRPAVRGKVFDTLNGLTHLRVDSVIVEKRKAAPSIRSLERFYPMMIENLLKYPLDPRGIDVQRFNKVFIFLDRELARRNEREALTKAVKVYLSRHIGKVPYVICMHPSGTHPYLQIVDYISWAIYRKWESGEDSSYRRIQHLVRSEFPIFASGYMVWY